MASRAIVPLQQPGGEGKLKNVQPEGRNRRVLQDIGNLVAKRAVEGKPHHAKALGKAQAAAVNNEKPIKEAVDAVAAGKGRAATKVVVPKKIVLKKKPIPEEVIVISSDEEEDEGKIARGRKSRQGSLRKHGKTFTSTLTARSKAACGLTNKPKKPIENIDAADIDNELAVVEYLDDMYNFYKHTECASVVHDYMVNQPDINAKMRGILVDWLIEVHRKFELMPETLYLTINIVDRFLSVKAVSRRELQLVGISSMLIASKYEEIWAPEVNDFVCISDNAYVKEQILVTEKAILEKLGWLLTVPTPYVFLVRYIKASIPSDQEMENTMFFLAELGIMHYTTIISHSPSMIAASAVYAARCTLDKTPFWTETLEHHTGYSEDQLKECAELLVSLHSAAAESKLKAVYRKFSSSDRATVALLTPAKSLSSKSLNSFST
ncbi:G2/mitotic-specific cyclin S13-7-like [Corylus avellana]|uniref:G2/mitotic-specific cyclin S13-7-like n=1 Tax=Corylus avellana TaxID=13451 RepID=UPI001E21B1B6|nr:G2/mitotic-specific cyclin S13-7-like [Corylus avellana]